MAYTPSDTKWTKPAVVFSKDLFSSCPVEESRNDAMASSMLTLDPEAQRKLEQLFRACDTKNSGFIGQQELRDLCCTLGIGAVEADALFLDLDCDGDGKIDFNDFAAGFREFVVSGSSSAAARSSETMLATAASGKNLDGNRIEAARSGEELEKKKKAVAAWKDFLLQLKRSSQHVVSHERIRELESVVNSTTSSPQLVSCFEQVFRGLITDVQRLQRENSHLEQTYKRERDSHEQHLHLLEEEMDVQVQQLEKKIRQQAKEEAEAERRNLKAQMDAEMAELQTHLKLFQSFDNWLRKDQGDDSKRVRQIQGKLEDASQENRQLRINLAETQTNIALLSSELAQLRSQYEDKCKQLNQEKEVRFEYLHEHDHLNRQLHLLHEANKRLQDVNDSLRSPRESPISSQRLLNYRQANANLKRGSVMGDYMLPEEEEPDDDDDDDKLTDSAVNRKRAKPRSHTSSIPGEVVTTEAEVNRCLRQPPHLGEELTYGIKRFMEDLDSGLSTMRDTTELDDAVSGFDDDDEPTSTHGRTQMEQFELETRSQSSSVRSKPAFVPIAVKSKSPSAQGLPDGTPIRPVPVHLEPIVTTTPTSPGSIAEPTGPADRTYKVVFAGDAAVGKSSFIVRISKGVFVPTLSSTLGVDFHVKTLRVDDANVALQLWDTAGQERFRSITKTYFRRADGVMLLYDCTNERSFLNVRNWMEAIDDVLEKRLPIMLCANKTDLRETAQTQGKICVTTESGDKLARDFAAIYLETSAKTGENVMDAVLHLTRQMAANEDLEVKTSAIKVTRLDNKKKNCASCKKN